MSNLVSSGTANGPGSIIKTILHSECLFGSKTKDSCSGPSTANLHSVAVKNVQKIKKSLSGKKIQSVDVLFISCNRRG